MYHPTFFFFRGRNRMLYDFFITLSLFSRLYWFLNIHRITLKPMEEKKKKLAVGIRTYSFFSGSMFDH